MRLQARNKNDERLKNSTLYVEVHHIIPRSLGGLDELSNLVEVLPEEHLFIHMLRYKIYKKREDALAVRCMLNGFMYKPYNKKQNLHIFLNKKIRMGYAWIRTHAQTIRRTEGWHTEDGLKRISEARKGKMPVKDKETGDFIGMVSNQHPNVISGKWVHHTKGRLMSEREKQMRRQMGDGRRGQNNHNASGLTEEYFIEKGLEAFREFGIILPWKAMLILSQKRGFKWIKSTKSRFDGKSVKGYYAILEEKTGTKFNSFTGKTAAKTNKKLQEIYAKNTQN
jgi:hypothetical protein